MKIHADLIKIQKNYSEITSRTLPASKLKEKPTIETECVSKSLKNSSINGKISVSMAMKKL